MIRLPNRVYSLIVRIYFTQKAIRTAEARAAAERYDQALRAQFAKEVERHKRGECGGYAAGCRYRPCYVVE